ncbi:hypothetical protein C2G38_2249285 [Gigaspora rosea]|uniref:Uncharacterized protein n=1 Tax=Gigaspora rosea TaxID=44941 RepID=A0A397URC8_9GLOM|nr:hypothetical protein C2G38_2249285 [Gigaspora rosea]
MHRLTFFILTVIFYLMGITSFVPGTEAFEVLILPLFGNDYDVCSVWMEDLNGNFITYIPQGINGDDYTLFYCGGHMPQYGDSGVTRPNEVITLQTLDRTTTYRIIFRVQQEDTSYAYYIQKDYTDDTCLVFMGYDHNDWIIEGLGYGECKFLRDGPPNRDDQNVDKDASNTFPIKSVPVKMVHL